MIARPKGISLNRNAANIQANANNVAQSLKPDPGRLAQRTPSPPKLASLRPLDVNALQQPENLINLADPPTKANLYEPLKPVNLANYQSENLELLKPLKPLLTIKEQQLQQRQLKDKEPSKEVGPPPLPKQQVLNLKSLDTKRPVAADIKQATTKSSIATLVRQHSKIPRLVEEEIEDIDKSSSGDAILLVCDVAKDIYSYMFELEQEQAIKPDYLKDQKILTPRVRQRLINWCYELCHDLELLSETLYMAVAIVDRYFERTTVKQQSQVQLACLGAVLIASKYEEIYPPEIHELCHLARNEYKKRDVTRIEIEILECLNFDLGRPIPLAFLRRFSKAAHCDLKMHSIAKFLMEISLTEYECVHWKPSLLAAAALYTTINLVYRDSSRWNRSLVHYTRYTKNELRKPAATLCSILKESLKSPQTFYAVKKNLANLSKWPELKSSKVDELIKLGQLAK